MTEAAAACVHQVGAPTARRELEYSIWGMFALSFGITAKPVAVNYRCSVCGKIFARSTDPEARRQAA